MKVYGANPALPAWALASDAAGNGSLVLGDAQGQVSCSAAQLRALLAGQAPVVSPTVSKTAPV